MGLECDKLSPVNDPLVHHNDVIPPRTSLLSFNPVRPSLRLSGTSPLSSFPLVVSLAADTDPLVCLPLTLALDICPDPNLKTMTLRD